MTLGRAVSLSLAVVALPSLTGCARLCSHGAISWCTTPPRRSREQRYSTRS